MPTVKSIHNSEHYTWGDGCDGWHLLKTNSLSVIQEKMPPGTSEQLHFHTNAQQVFYILSGVATFDVDGELAVVNANESLHIPKLTKHSISNKGNETLEFLLVSEPAAHGDRKNIEQ